MSGSGSVYAAILAFAVAFGAFSVVCAFSPSWGGDVLWGGVGVVDVAVPRVVTDREWYYVGEGGTATLEYYNPWMRDVVVVPPGRVTFYVEYPGQKDEARVIYFYDWEYENYTLGPGDSFRVDSFQFTAGQPGNMTLIVNDVRRTVEVLPRGP